MKQTSLRLLVLLSMLGSPLLADDVIEEAMKKFHKAPDGVDTISKKVSNKEASPQELADILKSYEAMATVTPPRGPKSSWDEKCQALISAVKKIQAGDATGVSAYKKAVNCKACHTLHKPN